jgi:hypothetical protein
LQLANNVALERGSLFFRLMMGVLAEVPRIARITGDRGLASGSLLAEDALDHVTLSSIEGAEVDHGFLFCL